MLSYISQQMLACCFVNNQVILLCFFIANMAEMLRTFTGNRKVPETM